MCFTFFTKFPLAVMVTSRRSKSSKYPSTPLRLSRSTSSQSTINNVADATHDHRLTPASTNKVLVVLCYGRIGYNLLSTWNRRRMNQKHSLINSFSSLKRKKLKSFSENGVDHNSVTTPAALSRIAALFPVEKFEGRLPPIVMRHQIYALIHNRTQVDRNLNAMRREGEIRLFKLGQNDTEVAIVRMKDYKQHVHRCCPDTAIVGNFLNVVSRCTDISYSKNILLNVYGLKDENISELVQQGLLTGRDVGCYWLSIPQVGEFVRSLVHGRRATLQCIRRTKYKELLQSELEKRKLPKKAPLGMLYHIYDIIGSDSVTCVDTSTGVVLRLQTDLVNGSK